MLNGIGFYDGRAQQAFPIDDFYIDKNDKWFAL